MSQDDEIDATLDRLTRDLGRGRVVATAVRAFLDQLDERLTAIADAADTTTLSAEAHRLAGSAEMLGAMDLGRRCRALIDRPDEPTPEERAAVVRPAEDARRVLADRVAHLELADAMDDRGT